MRVFFLFNFIVAFLPLKSQIQQIPSLALWLNADSIQATGNISSWQDLSSNSYTFNQAETNRRPLLVLDAINGKKALQFDGNDILLGGDILDIGTSNWSLFSVYRNNGSSEQVVFGKTIAGQGNNRYVHIPSNNRPNDSYVINGNFVVSAPANFSSANFSSVESVINRNNQTFSQFVNGLFSAEITRNLDPAFNINSDFNFAVGATSNLFAFLNGQIAEIIFLKNPTSAQRDSVYTYLGLKYTSDLSYSLPDTLNILASCPVSVSLDNKWSNVRFNNTAITGNTFTPTLAGWNYVSAIGPFGFPLRDSVFVRVVNPNPPLDNTFCEGNPIVWNLGNLDPSYQVTWNNGNLGNSLVITEPGIYELTVSREQCVVNHELSAVALADLITLEENFNVCSGSQLSATIPNPLPAFLNFAWSSGQANSVINVVESGPLSATLSNSRGCEATVNTSVNIVGIAPNTGFSFSGTCVDDTFTATDTTTFFGAESIAARYWILNGDTLPENSISLSLPLSSSNPFTLILSLVNSEGCNSFFTQNITVNPLPQVNFTLPAICLGKTLAPNNLTPNTQNLSFLWEVFDLGGQLLATSSQQNPSFNLGSVEQISIALTATNINNQCTNTQSLNFAFTPAIFCAVGNFAELWLNADSIPGTGNIQTWPDLSSNQYLLNQNEAARRPLVVDNAINGRKAVQFDGVNDVLVGGDFLDLGTDNWSMFSVYQNNGNSAQVVFGKGNAGAFNNRYFNLPTNNRPNDFYAINGDFQVTAPTSFSAANFNAVESVINRQTQTFSQVINGITVSSIIRTLPASTNINSDFNFAIGASANNFSFLNGQIAEIIFLENPTPSQRDSVYTYLGLKYASDLSYSIPDTLNILADCPISVSLDSKWNSLRLNNTAITGNTFTPTQAGWNYLSAVGPFGFPLRDSVFVRVVQAQTPAVLSFCETTPTVWNPNLSELYAYAWSNGSTQPKIEISEPGEYFVTISTETCSFTSPTLTFYNLESSSLGSVTQELCSGNSLVVQPNTDPSLNYLWSTGSTQPEITLTESGEYWVQVTNANGCVVQDTVQVNIIGIAPEVSFNVNGNCAENEITFESTANPLGSTTITSFEWLIEGNELNGESVAFNFEDAGNYWVQHKTTTQEGCSDSLRVLVQVDPLPIPQISHALLCHNNEVSINSNNSSISTGFITDRSWQIEGETLTGSTINYTFLQPGNIPAKLTLTSDAGCVDSLTQVLPVQGTPGVNILADEVCLGSPSIFQAQVNTTLSGTVNQYLWNFGNGQQSIFPVSTQTYQNAGLYAVNLEVIANNGCSNSAQINYRVNPFPTAQISAGNFCINTPTALSSSGSSISEGEITTWQWRINGALFSVEPSTNLTLNSLGENTLALRVISDAGCVANATQIVTVRPNPTPNFSFTPNIGLPPLVVNFNNLSATGLSHFWDFGTGDVSTAVNPIYTYLNEGNFTINLTSTDAFGCVGSTERNINVILPDIDLVLQNLSFEVENDYLYPVINVFNFSNAIINRFNIEASLNNGSRINETWFGNLNTNTGLNFRTNTGLFYQANRNNTLCVTLSNANNLGFDLTPENNSICIALSNSDVQFLEPYPNPSDGNISLSWIMPIAEPIFVSVTDLIGNTVLPRQLVESVVGINSINLNLNIGSGVYLIRYEHKDNLVVKKVVVR